ncbi:hypothetical protein RRG08_014714 [Elysia crispata]|uniref:Uncharacterized protein n=1 Tax=Elysia crispata TaxID=231223 RepID=A0AAE0YI95_9GAST|nr:hypothetical protein RRG08_014714 [Elysia crispata]
MPAVQQVDYVACSAQRRKVKRLHVLKVDRDIGGGSMGFGRQAVAVSAVMTVNTAGQDRCLGSASKNVTKMITVLRREEK